MVIPKSDKNQIVLICSNFNTGIVLNNDGSPYLDEGENYFEIINSLDEAIVIARQKIEKDNTIEVILYDHDGKFIKTIRPEK